VMILALQILASAMYAGGGTILSALLVVDWALWSPPSRGS
jgi:hypothetical protein